jgi:hypothetical protein
METWTRRFGKISKANADRMQRISKRQQQQRRMFRNLFKQPAPPFSKFFALRERAGINRKKPASSSQVIMGMMLTNTDTDARKGTAAIAPNYNVSSHMGVDYDKKAAMSLDGMFRPYSNDVDEDTDVLPHFETGTGNINAQTLNPFGSNHDISLVTHSSEIPDTLLSNGDADGTEKVRAMGIKLPAIGVGWGYDTKGKPVPNSDPDTPTDDFLDDHHSRMDKWKAGPIDLRWDDSAKVWTTTQKSVSEFWGLNFASSGVVGNVVPPVITTAAISDGLYFNSHTDNLNQNDLTVSSDLSTDTYAVKIEKSGVYRIGFTFDWDLTSYPRLTSYTVDTDGASGPTVAHTHDVVFDQVDIDSLRTTIHPTITMKTFVYKNGLSTEPIINKNGWKWPWDVPIFPQHTRSKGLGSYSTDFLVNFASGDTVDIMMRLIDPPSFLQTQWSTKAYGRMTVERTGNVWINDTDIA